jgi:TRAP-type mannitol/chloroaromatic compound transport system permease small subunit
MDLAYGALSLRAKALTDTFTVFFLIVYLGFLLYGGINSLTYSVEFGDRSPSAWRPYMWPIKAVTVLGILLMLLQAIAELFKDIGRYRTGSDDPYGLGVRGDA